MSDSSDDDLVLLENVYLKMRKTAIHPINRERKRFGEYHHLIVKKIKFDEQRFYTYTRMIQETFYYILDLVKNRLMKNWGNWHKQPILPEERLVVTIRLPPKSSVPKEVSLQKSYKKRYQIEKPTIHHHHQPINVPTAGAQAFPMDGIGRLGHDPPRGPSADCDVKGVAGSGVPSWFAHALCAGHLYTSHRDFSLQLSGSRRLVARASSPRGKVRTIKSYTGHKNDEAKIKQTA
ncbi:hypothetical protein evm_009784 [Chilo suppressalis]|nr:hypothetical protein evm_009784 [Chilo suppressalis]